MVFYFSQWVCYCRLFWSPVVSDLSSGSPFELVPGFFWHAAIIFWVFLCFLAQNVNSLLQQWETSFHYSLCMYLFVSPRVCSQYPTPTANPSPAQMPSSLCLGSNTPPTWMPLEKIFLVCFLDEKQKLNDLSKVTWWTSPCPLTCGLNDHSA